MLCPRVGNTGVELTVEIFFPQQLTDMMQIQADSPTQSRDSEIFDKITSLWGENLEKLTDDGRASLLSFLAHQSWWSEVNLTVSSEQVQLLTELSPLGRISLLETLVAQFREKALKAQKPLADKNGLGICVICGKTLDKCSYFQSLD